MPTMLQLYALLASACFALACATPAAAQAPQTERVSFEPGSNGTVITDEIEGYEIIDYILRASAGQRMMVVLETDNSSNYFNVMEPGSTGEAMYNSSIEGNRFEAGLPVDGDYTIRVYLMRNAARRNERASYSLEVNIFGPGTTVEAPADDYADGLGGGPDFWEVSGVGDGDLLNLRAGPSTKNRVIGQFANGDVLRNLGCQMSGGQKWCKVVLAGGDNDSSGWVAGRYLREAAGPSSDATVVVDVPVGNGQPFNATGEVPCALAAGQPMGSCAFGVIREGEPGFAGVWIDMNGAGERHILFEDGVPVATSPADEFSFERSGDLYLIRIADEERYEIPEAVVFGS